MVRDTLSAILARASDGEDLAISMKAILIDDGKAAFAIPALIETTTTAALFQFPVLKKLV